MGKSIDHTYAFLKTGPGNQYLKYADAWGGFYIGFEGFPLDLVDQEYNESLVPEDQRTIYKKFYRPLREIYRSALPAWRPKVRLALWNREQSQLELWQATDKLQPFPRQFILRLLGAQSIADLKKSKDWDQTLKTPQIVSEMSGREPADFEAVLQFLTGPSGCRFLPAARLSAPFKSEQIYAPIDTLSVLQALNRRAFRYMTQLNPTGVAWPNGIYDTSTYFDGPDGEIPETQYGRFVRQYLDSLVEPARRKQLQDFTANQRVSLIGATLNPLLVETAAMLFAIDIGMVIDSGPGKGRQGIDVVAACGTRTTPDAVLERLNRVGVVLRSEAIDNLKQTRTLPLQCKGFQAPGGLLSPRIVEFRPMRDEQIGDFHGIPLNRVLDYVARTENGEFNHLKAWIDRMTEVVFNPPRS